MEVDLHQLLEQRNASHWYDEIAAHVRGRAHHDMPGWLFSLLFQQKWAELCAANVDFSGDPAAEVHASDWERYPDLFAIEKEQDRIRLENEQFAHSVSVTDQFRCSSCKGNRCVYSTAQTRSADEGMTVFVSCTTCGHNWRA